MPSHESDIPVKQESIMGAEIEVNRWVSDNDECPRCCGIGKLDEPGAPDCPYCKGMGVMEVFLQGLPQNEAKAGGKSPLFR
jgi:DnaJ-class molecular chaperone